MNFQHLITPSSPHATFVLSWINSCKLLAETEEMKKVLDEGSPSFLRNKILQDGLISVLSGPLDEVRSRQKDLNKRLEELDVVLTRQALEREALRHEKRKSSNKKEGSRVRRQRTSSCRRAVKSFAS